MPLVDVPTDAKIDALPEPRLVDMPEDAKMDAPSVLGLNSGNIGSEINRRVSEFGTGAYKGVANLVGLPHQLGERAERDRKRYQEQTGREPLPFPAGGAHLLSEAPSADKVREFFFGKMGIPKVEPTDALGRGLANVGETMGSMPLPGLKVGAMNLGGGLGKTAGEELYRGTPNEQTAGTVGLIAGSGIPGIASMAARTPAQMIAARTKGMTAADWAEGIKRQAEANRLGAPLLAPEALNNPPLARLASDTMASKAGGTVMETFLRDRPGQAQAVAQRNLGALGPAQLPEDVAQKVQKAATDAIRDAEKGRTAGSAPFYQAAAPTTLPDHSVAFLAHELDTLAANAPEAVAAQLLGLKTRMLSKPTIGALSGEVKLLREATAPAALNVDLATKQAASRAQPFARKAETEMEAESPMYATGQQKFREATPAVRELKEGDIGRMASPTPDEVKNVSGKLASQARIIFNSDTARPDTIRYVSQQLSKADPEAFRDLVRNHLETTLNKAFKDVKGQADISAPVNWRDAIAGTQQQRQNLAVILEEAAKASGGNPALVTKGFANMLDTFERMGRVPGAQGAYVARGEAASEAAKGGALNSAAQAMSAPMRTAWEKFRDMATNGNFEALAKVFTSPEGVKMMQHMAFTKPMNAKSAALAVQTMNLARTYDDAPKEP